MRTRANPTLIGLFVLGAIALALVAVAVFGSVSLFQPTRTAVAFFQGSVAGLNPGAPVTFRGVRIGEVKDIRLTVAAEDMTANIPVYLEFELDRIQWAGDEGLTQERMNRLIERGLRAKLVSRSYVTGQLAVELDFQLDQQAQLVEQQTDVPQIPTAPSDLEALKTTLEQLPLSELVATANQTIKDLRALVGADAAGQVVPELRATLEAYRELAVGLRAEIEPISGELQRTSAAAAGSFDQARQSIERIEKQMTSTLDRVDQMVATLDSRAPRLADRLETSAAQASRTLEQTRETLKNANEVLAPGSQLQRDLRTALNEFANAARAVRALAEELERNPGALLTGKRESR